MATNALLSFLTFLWDASWFAIQTLFAEAEYILLAYTRRSNSIQAAQVAPLNYGKVLVITGGSCGIGREVATQWLQSGGRCIVLSRTPTDIQNADETRLQWLHCDLSSFRSVNEAIKKLLEDPSLDHIDALVCCAGVMMPDVSLQTPDGHDLSFQVNHLSHAQITLKLAHLLDGASSIILLSSVAHVAARGILQLPHGCKTTSSAHGSTSSSMPLARRSGYKSASTAYAESKLANIVWAKELARHFSRARAPADVPTVASLHPGIVHTRLYRHLPTPLDYLQQVLAPVFFRAPSEPAAEILQLSARPSSKTGQYFVRGCAVQPIPLALDPVLGEELWRFTLDALAVSSTDAERALLLAHTTAGHASG